jgi:hypothetical protein
LVVDPLIARAALDALEPGGDEGFQELLLIAGQRAFLEASDDTIHVHLAVALCLEQIRGHALDRGPRQRAAAGIVNRHEPGTAL